MSYSSASRKTFSLPIFPVIGIITITRDVNLTKYALLYSLLLETYQEFSLIPFFLLVLRKENFKSSVIIIQANGDR